MPSFGGETEPAARELALELQTVEARAPDDFEVAFAAATRSNAGALIALDDALTYNYRTRVVALAAASRLPALYGYVNLPTRAVQCPTALTSPAIIVTP